MIFEYIKTEGSFFDLDQRVDRFCQTRRLGSKYKRELSEGLYFQVRQEGPIIATLLQILKKKKGFNDEHLNLLTKSAFISAVYLQQNGSSELEIIRRFHEQNLLPEGFLNLFKAILPDLMAIVAAPHPQQTPEEIATAFSMPAFIYDLLAEKYQRAAIIEILASLNRSAPVYLRMVKSPLKQEKTMQELVRKGIAYRKCQLSALGLVFAGNIDLFSLKSFKNGWVAIQDEGSQIVALLSNPQAGQLVLDACCGSGGKSLVFSELMDNEGGVVGVDTRQSMKRKYRTRCKAMGVENATFQLPAQLTKYYPLASFDQVFVDAPCSGSGTLRRKPHLRLQLTAEKIVQLAVEQEKILTEYSRFVKVGGRLYYVTCSIFPQENEQVVAKFLSANPHFGRVEFAVDHDYLNAEKISWAGKNELTLLPHLTETDGFFIAALQRKKENGMTNGQ